MQMSFRKLSKEEEADFRSGARESYKPFSEIKGIWHPVYQDECKKINEENSIFVDDRKESDE